MTPRAARTGAESPATRARGSPPAAATCAFNASVRRVDAGRRVSSSRASTGGSGASVISSAPSEAVSVTIRSRLVTITRHSAAPGSSGRTCPAPSASSSSKSIRRPARWLRNSAARAPVPAGISSSATPSMDSRDRRASAALTGGPSGSDPRRSRWSCPSGKRAATRCAQCTASADLPTPGMPSIATTGIAGPVRSSRSARSRSPARPVKAGRSRGSRAGFRRAPGRGFKICAYAF